MRKRILSVLAAIVIVVSSVVPSVSALSKQFSDVKQGDWFYEAVNSVVDNGLFSGMSDHAFGPHEAMTRAMFVQVLANFTKDYTEPEAGEIALFTDASKNAWYYNAVQWAAQNGIISGKGNAIFDPNGKITRQEMVTMLFNYALKTGETTNITASSLKGFSDAQKISSWAETAMQWAVSNKIIVGTGDSILSPTTTSTRAHVAAMFNNAYSTIENRKVIENNIELAEDPEKDYLQVLDYSKTKYGSLSNSKDVSAETAIENYYSYTGFTEYPDITIYFYKEKPDNDSYIGMISVPATNIFPQIINKTTGEIYGALGGSAVLYTQSETDIDFITAPYIYYETESFCYYIEMDADTMKVTANSQVFINVRTEPAPVEVPENLTLSLDFKGMTVCTFTLPESYKNVIATKKLQFGNEEEAGLFLDEPVSSLRYGFSSPDGGTLLSLFISPGRFTQQNYLYVKYFEIEGKEYSLYVTSGVGAYDGTDQEVVSSFKAMKAETDKIVETIKMNETLTLI